MRFTVLARRLIMTAALGLALTGTLAACSSSSPSSSTPTATPSSPATTAASSSAPASSSTASAEAEIKANWEKFFSSSTPTSERVTLLQNGSKFTAAITALAKLPLASGIGATVTAVTVKSPTSAAVTYNLTGNGSTLLSGQSGTAVYQDGTWKVGDASLCALFKLVPGGTVPSACNSAS
jgi:hypothetical protein